MLPKKPLAGEEMRKAFVILAELLSERQYFTKPPSCAPGSPAFVPGFCNSVPALCSLCGVCFLHALSIPLRTLRASIGSVLFRYACALSVRLCPLPSSVPSVGSVCPVGSLSLQWA